MWKSFVPKLATCMDTRMKLWQKIFLCTLAPVMAAISITGILLLSNNHEVLMKQQHENAWSEHEYLISNLKTKIITERLKKNAIILDKQVVYEIVEDIFKKNESKYSPNVGFYNMQGELYYKNNQYESSMALVQSVIAAKEAKEQVIEDRERTCLNIASFITIENVDYVFVSFTDVTEIFDICEEQLYYIKQISLCSAFGIAVFLLIIVKILLLPLKKLNKGTKAIAEGEYQKRIDIKGNHELSDLGKNMNVMAASIEKNILALENVAEDRKRFISNLSHEMKTPLTSIVGFADLMRIKKEISEKEYLEYTGIISEEAKRLRTLSGRLMELITVGETNLDWKEWNVKEVFVEIEKTFELLMKKHQITFLCSCEEGMILMDKELFKSMIYNLLDNAIKASKEQSEIILNGVFGKDAFFISVKDCGCGIPKKEIEHIKQPFYMLDKARSRENGGAGLGLSLCMEIAKVHRGSLDIESEVGLGTCIYVKMKGGKKFEI